MIGQAVSTLGHVENWNATEKFASITSTPASIS